MRSFLGSGRASLADVRADPACQGEPQPWAAMGVPIIGPPDTPAESLRGRRKEKDMSTEKAREPWRAGVSSLPPCLPGYPQTRPRGSAGVAGRWLRINYASAL